MNASASRAGRPAELIGGRRVNVYLDQESLAIAERLSPGKMSKAIRYGLLVAEAIRSNSLTLPTPPHEPID